MFMISQDHIGCKVKSMHNSKKTFLSIFYLLRYYKVYDKEHK